MALTLTTDAKDWIAQNLGISNCMTETSRTFTYHDSVNDITYTDNGGTATIFNALIDSACDYVVVAGTTHYASTLKSKNGNVTPEFPEDVQWVMANDSGTAQYCYSASTPNIGDLKCGGGDVYRWNGTAWAHEETCGFGCSGGVCLADSSSPTTTAETGPLEVTIASGEQYPGGTDVPSVILDTSSAYAYFSGTPLKHVGVGEIFVVNQSPTYYAYFAWVMRMWHGPLVGTTCPTSPAAHNDVSRYLGEVSDKKKLTTIFIDSSENKETFGTFNIPQDYTGKKTICLTLWGNYSKDALIAELGAAGYEEEIDW